MPVMIATIKPKEGEMDNVQKVFEEVIPLVHQEDGCELYALHRGQDRFVFVEKWRDGAALGAHGSSPNMKTLNEKLAGLVAERPDIQMVEPVPAGDPGKGRLP